jgi:hypothetical protein
MTFYKRVLAVTPSDDAILHHGLQTSAFRYCKIQIVKRRGGFMISPDVVVSRNMSGRLMLTMKPGLVLSESVISFTSIHHPKQTLQSKLRRLFSIPFWHIRLVLIWIFPWNKLVFLIDRHVLVGPIQCFL